jgi:Ca2+-transporting ATPase
MDRKPRPLTQPVLSRSQWARLIFTGVLIAIGTLYLERVYEPVDPAIAATMGFAVFSLFNIAFGLSARSETETIFNRENLADRRQLGLFGLSLLLTFLATELGFMQRLLGTVSLFGDYKWLICILFAVALLLVDEVIKFFMRQRRQPQAVQSGQTVLAPSTD